MQLYITRHGETLWNKEGRMQGWKNSDLTEKGIENAEKLGKSLINTEFDRVYCSPAGRTLQTAKCILQHKNNEIIPKDYLREMCFGIWEGMSYDDIKEKYSIEHYNMWNKPQEYVPVLIDEELNLSEQEIYNGESYADLINRAKTALEDIYNTSKSEGHETVLVVTHAAFIKAIYSIVKKLELKDFWQEPFVYDTSLSILEINEDGMNFILECDVSHL